MWWWIMLGVLAAAGGALLAVKLYIKATTGVCRCSARLDGRTALVTGSNTGIGYWAAVELARRGARVLLLCRDEARAAAAVQRARDLLESEGGVAGPAGHVEWRRLDLGSLASVRECAAHLLATEPAIHLLVNNAGAGGLGQRRSSDAIDIGLQINYFGPFLLTALLRERLAASGSQTAPARVVWVAAWGHKLAAPDLEDVNMQRAGAWSDAKVYCHSKLYEVACAVHLTRLMQERGAPLVAHSLHPGIVDTEIFRNMAAWAREPIRATIKLFLKTAREGAQSTLHACLAPELAHPPSRYLVDCRATPPAPLALDLDFGRRLWVLSERLVDAPPLPPSPASTDAPLTSM